MVPFSRAGTTPIFEKKRSHQFRESLWELLRELWFSYFRKIPAPIKIKSALPPPPNPKYPPPKTRNVFLDMEVDMEFSCRKKGKIPGAHKIGAATSGPRIADKKFYGREDFF